MLYIEFKNHGILAKEKKYPFSKQLSQKIILVMIGNSLSAVGKAKIAGCYFRPLCPERLCYTTTNVNTTNPSLSAPCQAACPKVLFLLPSRLCIFIWADMVPACPQGFPISEANPAILLEGNFKIFSSSF